MSASRCFRCTLDAARPAKRINIQSRPALQLRSYASDAQQQVPKVKHRQSNTPVTNPQAEKLRKQPKGAITPNQDSASITQNDSSNQPPTALSHPSQDADDRPYPPNVLAAFRTPYRHPRTHGIPVASLQLRSYSVRNLEFFSDFAMRVAYYLKLPASGPGPLPKRIERWTMPRSNFVHKKSQENFERITYKRLITVYDGHPDVVEIWLAALRRWQFYGVGLKANVWHFEGLDVASKMDKDLAVVQKELDTKLANFGWNSSAAGEKSIREMLVRQGARVAGAPVTEVRDEIKAAKNIDLFRDVKSTA